MKLELTKCKSTLLSLISIVFIGVASSSAMAQSATAKLEGSQETPAVATSATGSTTVKVAPDKSVSGTITTQGIVAKAAHIHTGAPGVAGPIIVPFVKTDENSWKIADGAKLTDEQYANYKAGNLYVNVHSDAYPKGEIRGQLKP